ncbi:hypothetical protein Q4F19_10950 [Sphingomonas sp. BIUV-7]|uniref:Uncharacterized protein n=1 Tax=Sphingomonas natans TaxID=3063330 RepID=A0ABT8YB13_9SPHN|nr:hypothetical protein [Sphingomonas sp. BIUV-7]MDO6414899.1 hypothetical protein [Sphingomonas sp. BIUV-7]
MDVFDQIRTARATWIADNLGSASVQGMRDARTLLAEAIAGRNEAMIRTYSETCLLLLEAHRERSARLMAMMTIAEPND